MTTTPKPPKGRRWLREGEIKRKFDRLHGWGYKVLNHWILTIDVGGRVIAPYEYSRAIRRKTTRK